MKSLFVCMSGVWVEERWHHSSWLTVLYCRECCRYVTPNPAILLFLVCIFCIFFCIFRIDHLRWSRFYQLVVA